MITEEIHTIDADATQEMLLPAIRHAQQSRTFKPSTENNLRMYSQPSNFTVLNFLERL